MLGSTRYTTLVLLIAAAAACSNVSPDPAGNMEGPAPDAGIPNTCSADGQSVLDEDGNIVETCTVGALCSQGVCLPACEAAADSGGSVGCDFIAAPPRFYSGGAACFAVFLANNGNTPTDIGVTYAGSPLDVTAFARTPTPGGIETWAPLTSSRIEGGEVAVLFLMSSTSSYQCPASIQAAVGPEGLPVSGAGTAFEITTSLPVSAYDMNPFGGASSFLPSAELLLPTTAWGTNYIAVNPPASNRGGGSYDLWGQVVASQDGTTISISPSVALPAAGPAPAAPVGETTSFTLNAGEYVEWTTGAQLTGSVIQSDKPISFVGGDTYICYQSASSSGGGCDSSHQMLPPVHALSDQYAIAPHPPRNGLSESVRYQLVGMVDGTNLVFLPPIDGAPAVINAGQEMIVETAEAFAVASQDRDHPFAVSQTMAGCYANGGTCIGDEEVVLMLPPAQFLSKYVFLTDPTYATTRLSVVRERHNGVFEDVTVGCIGAITGWQPMADPDYEYAYVDLVVDGLSVGSCTTGREVASSEGPFGMTIWGMDHAASYGYPAGGGVAAINDVVVPPVE